MKVLYRGLISVKLDNTHWDAMVLYLEKIKANFHFCSNDEVVASLKNERDASNVEAMARNSNLWVQKSGRKVTIRKVNEDD